MSTKGNSDDQQNLLAAARLYKATRAHLEMSVNGVIVRDGRIIADGKDVTDTVILTEEDYRRKLQMSRTIAAEEFEAYLRKHIEVLAVKSAAKSAAIILESSPPSTTPLPPQTGEQLLYLFLSKEHREYLPGDLAEEFAMLAEKHGIRYAKFWYWKQVAGSVGPVLWGYAWKLFSVASKLIF